MYTPTVWFDGWDEYVGTSNYEAIYQAHVAVPTDVTFELTADPAGEQTTDVHANVCIESGGSGKTMRIYMAEVLDYYPPPAVEANQRNCLMQGASSTQDITLAPGECEEVIRSWARKENIKIIVWAQQPFSSGPADVYQAGIMPWPFPPHEVPGDMDEDGDVDQDDADLFMYSCYTGPGGGVPDGCEPVDFDGDGDVDCDDWETFKLAWTEPMPPYPSFFPECDVDCNGNSVADEWDIDAGTSEDCNTNESPDECEIPVSSGGLCTVDCDPDCNTNAVPDECDIAGPTSEDCQPNDVPDECDIEGGTSTDVNTNGVPDECEIYEILAEDCGPACEAGTVPCVDDDDCEGQARCVGAVCYAPKHRYLSIARNLEQMFDTARRVKLYSGEILGWVGEPYYEEATSQHDGLCLTGIVAEPYYATAWGCYSEDPPYSIDVVHLMGCEISTGQWYEVQAIGYGFPIGDEMYYSPELELHTPGFWGDTVSGSGSPASPPDGVSGLIDIMSAIGMFQGNPVAPITWLDIAPSTGSATPDQVVGLGDIMGCIAGFQGEPYPGFAPLDCP
jgi:hypothetical protein